VGRREHSVQLLVVGIFDVIQGLVALFRADVYVVGASGLVLSTDWTTGGAGRSRGAR